MTQNRIEKWNHDQFHKWQNTHYQPLEHSPTTKGHSEKLSTQFHLNHYRVYGTIGINVERILILKSFYPKEMVWDAVLAQYWSRRATAAIPILSLIYSTCPLQIFVVRWKVFQCLWTGYTEIVKWGRGQTAKQGIAPDKPPECIPSISQYNLVIWKHEFLALNCLQLDVCPIRHGIVEARNLWRNKTLRVFKFHATIVWQTSWKVGRSMLVYLKEYRISLNHFLYIRLPRQHGAPLNLDFGSLQQYSRRVGLWILAINNHSPIHPKSCHESPFPPGQFSFW